MVFETRLYLDFIEILRFTNISKFAQLPGDIGLELVGLLVLAEIEFSRIISFPKSR